MQPIADKTIFESFEIYQAFEKDMTYEKKKIPEM